MAEQRTRERSEYACVSHCQLDHIQRRYDVGMTVNALAMLTEFFRTASLTVTLQQFPMRTHVSLALTLTWDAPLPTVTVPVDIELISSTATFTVPTKELFPISIVRSHSECLGVTRVICIHIKQFVFTYNSFLLYKVCFKCSRGRRPRVAEAHFYPRPVRDRASPVCRLGESEPT